MFLIHINTCIDRCPIQFKRDIKLKKKVASFPFKFVYTCNQVFELAIKKKCEENIKRNKHYSR